MSLEFKSTQLDSMRIRDIVIIEEKAWYMI
jgi:hypothetical protein